MTHKKTELWRSVIVIAVALSIIAASIMTTLYLSGTLFGERASDSKGYRNTTFTDAVLLCESEIRDEFGRYLSQLVADDHSSRFDNASNLYKLFFNLDIKSNGDQVDLYYVSCYVKAGNGRIAKFDAIQSKEAPQSDTIRQGGDKFIEWPQ